MITHFPSLFILNLSPYFAIMWTDRLAPLQHYTKTRVNISSCKPNPGISELASVPYTSNWKLIEYARRVREFNWQSCSDLNCATWNLDHLRQQFTFLTVATDSTSWPCESHLNTFNPKKNRERKERKEEEKTSVSWLKIYSALWFFMHTWSSCWQPWKLSSMDCCTEVSNLDGNQWQVPFDSQIMTSTLQATARHSPTSPTCSNCCAATKWRVRG